MIKKYISKKYIYTIYIYLIILIINMQKNVIMRDITDVNIDIDINAYNNCIGTAIIGGGPAGLAASIYSSRFGIPSAVFMGTLQPGGQLTTTGIVENVPGCIALTGNEIINNCKKQAEVSGSLILYEEVKNIDTKMYPYKIITDKNTYYAFSIIIATGSLIKQLNCKGESKYWGNGVSSCAICDAPLHKNKIVCVVGGGDSACEEALQLAPHAKKIYLFVRGEKMRASNILQEKVKNNNKIIIQYNTEIEEIKGTLSGVSDVILNNNKTDESYSLSDLEKEPISGVFIAIGHIPNTHLVKDIVKLNEHGFIECKGRNQETSFPGIFASGDVVAGTYKQAAIACGQGVCAAIDAFEYLIKLNINTNFFEKHQKSFLNKKNNNKILEEKQLNEQIIVCNGESCSIIKPSESHLESNSKNDKEKDTKDNLYKEIHNEKQYHKIRENTDYHILYLYGSACPSCIIMKKIIQEYNNKKHMNIPIYGINIEKIPSMQNQFHIRSIPTIIILKNEKIITKKIGTFNDLKSFENFITKNID